jgi:hypothetical protein
MRLTRGSHIINGATLHSFHATIRQIGYVNTLQTNRYAGQQFPPSKAIPDRDAITAQGIVSATQTMNTFRASGLVGKVIVRGMSGL